MIAIKYLLEKRQDIYRQISFLLFVIFCYLLITSSGWCSVNLTIFRPTNNFNTNNDELTIEGKVDSEKEKEILLSINTPAGIPELSEIGYSLHSIVLDLGSNQNIKGVLFTPYIDPENELFPYGPRKVKVLFSNNATDFDKEKIVYVASLGEYRNEERITTEFDEPVSGRFVQIEMLQGWQKYRYGEILQDQIILSAIELLNTNNQIIQPKMISFSLILPTNEQGEAKFKLSVSLKEGKNRIAVMARLKEVDFLEAETEEEYQDSQEISLIYIPELTTEDTKERFILSDGYKAKLILPTASLDEQIKRIKILSISPDSVDLHSYFRNSQIVEGTKPIIVYKFEALRKRPFVAKASASMEEQPASLAVDGISQPPSTWITGFAPLPVEIIVDLGDNYVVSKIIINSLVEGGKSFAPNIVEVYTSDVGDKDSDFIKITKFSGFADHNTEIPLVTMPTFRWVKLLITEGKQANTIGINEIKFYDESGTQIISYYRQEETRLSEPALMFLSYDEDELSTANIDSENDLAVFAYDKQINKWHFVGGSHDKDENTVTVQLNYLTQFALFQAVKPSEIEVMWNYKIFSPDGNGIADVNVLTINLSNREIKSGTKLVVEIFNLNGRLIKTLVDRNIIESSSISIEWDGKDRNGKVVPIGPYIYQVQLGEQVRNGTIVVAK